MYLSDSPHMHVDVLKFTLPSGVPDAFYHLN